ncbi:MAG: hypothetical protein ACP5E3_16275 [Bacteroidales bacterium]
MKSLKLFLAKKILTLAVLFSFALLSINLNAQDEEESFILSLTEFTVKPGHDFEFREGIKAWKDCYLENGGEWSWTIWRRVQGEGNVYILSSSMSSWAEMDETGDEAGKECRDMSRELINPHIEKAKYNLARYMPEMSKTEPMEYDVVWVTNWTVNDGDKFRGTVNEITDIIRDVEGDPRGFWYGVMGGAVDEADYFVVDPYKNFAAMDEDRDGVWTLVEKSKGEKKKDELRQNFLDSVDEAWAYMYTREKELSRPSPEDE